MSAEFEAIRLEYISSDMSYRQLAAKYGVSVHAVYRVGKRDGWVEAREQYRGKVQAKAVDKMAEREAGRLARLQGAAELLVEAVSVALTERRMLLQTRDESALADSRALKDYSVTLKNAVDVVRNLYGIPTLQEQSAMDIAAERLLLDKSRAAQGVGDDETGVVVLAEVVDEDALDGAGGG